jgi:adenylate kinase family enzyme
LIQREDDRPAVVQARLEKQLGALADVVDHYRSAGVLQTVDGRQPIAAVTSDLLACIEPAP